jgi:hypothetical protein
VCTADELCDVGGTYQGDDVVEQMRLAYCHTHEPFRFDVDDMNMEVICILSADPIDKNTPTQARGAKLGSGNSGKLGGEEEEGQQSLTV